MASFMSMFVHSCTLFAMLWQEGLTNRIENGMPSLLEARLQKTGARQVEGLIGSHAISEEGLPDEVWKMRKLLTEHTQLEDEPTCGKKITERKQKLNETLMAIYKQHEENAALGKPTTAVVVGGGPVGLVAAMEAFRGGATVHVLEQRNGYARLQNVEVETPDAADVLLQTFFEQANALAEVYEVVYKDPPKSPKNLVSISPAKKKSIRNRLDKLMSLAPQSERLCYYLKSTRHTCVIKTVEALLAAAVSLLGEQRPGSLKLHYFTQYLTTCDVRRAAGVSGRPRAVFQEVETREQRKAAPPPFPCSEDLPSINNVSLLVDATGGRGNVRKEFIARKYGDTCHSHWQVRAAKVTTHNGVTVPLVKPEVLEMAKHLDIDYGEEDALSIVARRIDGVVCPRFSNNGVNFEFELPIFAEDGGYVGKGPYAKFSEYFWSGLPRFSESACQYVPLLRVPRSSNPIAKLLLAKSKARGKMKTQIDAHLLRFAQAFIGSMHKTSLTNRLFHATDGGMYPKYEFGPMSVTLFKTSLRVPPHGDSIRAFPSIQKPSIVFAETGDQESPAYYRTGSGISAGANRASRLAGIVRKLASDSLSQEDVRSWQVSTMQLALKKYCLATNYMLTNTMFPNRFYGTKEAMWTQSNEPKICGERLGCSMGNIFEEECYTAVNKTEEVEKLIEPSTAATSEIHKWLSMQGAGDECPEHLFENEVKKLEGDGHGEYYSTELKD